MGLLDRLRGGSSAPETFIVIVDLPPGADPDQVIDAAAGWAARERWAPGTAAELVPGVIVGGPSTIDASARWVVTARAPKSGTLVATPTTGDPLTDLLSVAESALQAWREKGGGGRDDIVCGAPALAVALGDGLARRFAGTIAVGGGRPAYPPAAEPTRALFLTTRPEADQVISALSRRLGDQQPVDGVGADDGWVLASDNGFGLWLSERDPLERLAPGAAEWVSEATPDQCPPISRPEHAWILRIEGPDDVATPEVDVALDAAARALAVELGAVAVDAEGFPLLGD